MTESKAVLVMDMPDHCMNCPMCNSCDECILQDDDANFEADTWEKQKESGNNSKELEDSNNVSG